VCEEVLTADQKCGAGRGGRDRRRRQRDAPFRGRIDGILNVGADLGSGDNSFLLDAQAGWVALRQIRQLPFFAGRSSSGS